MAGIWEELIDARVADRYRLRALTCDGGEQAEYRAAAPDTVAPVTVTLIHADPREAPAMLADMREAARIDHPNILRVLDAGTWARDGKRLLFLVTETAAETLGEAAGRGLPESAIRALAHDLLAGLKYLHGRGLAYGCLEPGTVVRAGDDWKLADLGGISDLPGKPAQDVRDFGALLRGVASQSEEGLPESWTAAIDRCLDPDPARRPSVAELQAELEPRAPAHVKRSIRVRWAPVIVLAALIAVLAVAASLWRRGAQRPTAPVPAAKSQPAPPAVVEKPSAMPAPDGTRVRRKAAAKAGGEGQEGLADYSSSDMNGRLTASGERFDSNALTAAHDKYRLGTRLRVTNPRNGRSVTVRVNDRARFRGGHIIRLTKRAAQDLGIAGNGSARVKVEAVK